LGFLAQEGVVYYFHGQVPTFRHEVGDRATFRFYIAQLVANGTATQAEIARAFGIPASTVKRAVRGQNRRMILQSRNQWWDEGG
jgi:hypothetical protein